MTTSKVSSRPVVAPQPAAGVGIERAGALAMKGARFTVDEQNAKKLVRLYPRNLLGTQHEALTFREGRWRTSSGARFGVVRAALVQVDFPKALRWTDGPYTGAFLDVEGLQAYFVRPAEKEAYERLASSGQATLDTLQCFVGSWPEGVVLQPVPGTEVSAPSAASPAPVDTFTGAPRAGTKLTAAALAKRAQDFVLARAGGGRGKPFPAVHSGNLGLSAYLVRDAQAATLLQAMKEALPGDKRVQKFEFDPKEHQLLVVVTSDDEPELILTAMSARTGEGERVGKLAVLQLPLAPFGLPAGADAYDALSQVCKGGRFLSLGAGSAPREWWQGGRGR